MERARVSAGFFSFTEVPAGAHRAYNEWHLLDHLPEQYRLAGIAHGERWVASPDCVAGRVVDNDVVGPAQYVTVYLIGDPVDETLRRFRELAVELRNEGRFHEARTAHLFGAWQLSGTALSPDVVLSPSVLPWRPATGVFVLAEPTSDDPNALDGLVEVEGVVGGWGFEPVGEDLRHSSWLVQPWRFTVLWLDGDPAEVAGRLAPAVPESAVFAAPYRTVSLGDWGGFD